MATISAQAAETVKFEAHCGGDYVVGTFWPPGPVHHFWMC